MRASTNKFSAALYAFSASSDDVVASSSGVECFWTVASDSPTRVLNFVASWLRTFSTSSFRAAGSCSWSRRSPVPQFSARRPSTYWVPRLAIDPVTTAVLPVRTQTSRAIIVGQSRAGGLPHQLERLADAFLRYDAQKRRLLELHREPLTQRFVEYRVAGRVREIGEDDGVLVGQLRRAMQVHVAADNRRGESHACRCQRQGPPQRLEPLTAASPEAIGIDSLSRFARRRSAPISDAC